jgi:predicted transcriptional regulator of viral defense system
VNNYALAKQTILENDGIARNADFLKKGLKNYQITYLCNKGFLERVRRGYYKLSSFEESTDEKIIARLFPDGILCMDSALFHYGYTDRTPLEWTIAFQRTVTRSRLKINFPKIKPYFISKEIFTLGKTEQTINDIQLFMYDRDRTICDCFKYQNKLDSELFSKAVLAYSKDQKKNIANLSDYAKKMRVYNKMAEILGVLLNG